jgi:hypothetical protein
MVMRRSLKKREFGWHRGVGGYGAQRICAALASAGALSSLPPPQAASRLLLNTSATLSGRHQADRTPRLMLAKSRCAAVEGKPVVKIDLLGAMGKG